MSGPADPGYEAALRALQDRGRFGIRLGLGRTRALLAGLGHPEEAFRGALIAGTNGKGSVLALVESCLRAEGMRVGATPKPHLVTYRERMQIDGRLIPADVFARLVNDALPLADRVARRHGDPTEFELLTALTFRWFADSRVDVAVVEVGLGGRLDATHAWDGGVAAITNIDLDHMAQLGATIPLIAKEKAAIIERGDLAVTGATGEALAVIRRRARRMGVPLVETLPAPLLGMERDGIEVELPSLGRTRVALRGRHQAANVAVADAVLDALGEAGIARVSDDARRRGYRDVRWPGRLELLEINGAGRGGETVELLLDGAHNPAGARTLATAVEDLRPFLRGERVTLLVGLMADKDVDGAIEALAGADGSAALREARVICTRVDEARAMQADDLAAEWARVIPGSRPEAENDLARALDAALANATGPVVVAGSLHLVGAVRGRLVQDPALQDPTPA